MLVLRVYKSFWDIWIGMPIWRFTPFWILRCSFLFSDLYIFFDMAHSMIILLKMNIVHLLFWNFLIYFVLIDELSLKSLLNHSDTSYLIRLKIKVTLNVYMPKLNLILKIRNKWIQICVDFAHWSIPHLTGG